MELPQIDTWKVERFLTDFIQNCLRRARRKKVLVGVSGGLDSAAAAVLASEALGPRNVIGLILPFRSSSPDDARDALDLCLRFKIRTRTIEITPMVDAYFELFPHANWLRRGNKMARERMSILYDWAAYHDALVLGTSNRTELLLGYFTKHGDGAADLEPLGGLYKTEVRQLAASLGVPEKIIAKTPTAGLWKGQTDEKELGFSYDLLDSLLYHLLDKKWSQRKLLQAGFSWEAIKAVLGRIKNSEHKRRIPPVPFIPPDWRKSA